MVAVSLYLMFPNFSSLPSCSIPHAYIILFVWQLLVVICCRCVSLDLFTTIELVHLHRMHASSSRLYVDWFLWSYSSFECTLLPYMRWSVLYAISILSAHVGPCGHMSVPLLTVLTPHYTHAVNSVIHIHSHEVYLSILML